jgi:hypothetical protein
MKTRITSIVFLTSLIIAAVFSVRAVQAATASQEQELEQETHVNCTTGAYGQNQNCDVTTKQRGKQKQEIVFREGRVLAAHQVVDTALDTKTMAIVAGLLILGSAATYGFVKTRNL